MGDMGDKDDTRDVWLLAGRNLLLDLRFLSCDNVILDVTLGRATEREPGKKKLGDGGGAGGSPVPLDVGVDGEELDKPLAE
jgi:hypothetical protein